MNMVPDYSKTAKELFVEIVDQRLEWDDARR